MELPTYPSGGRTWSRFASREEPTGGDADGKHEAASVPPAKASVAEQCQQLAALLVLAVATVTIRKLFTHVRANDPTAEQLELKVTELFRVKPGYEDNVAYFDLGGTYCLCEKRWSTQEYWEKTLSGLAFNFPHLIDGFIFTFATGNLTWILIGIFTNEFIEELLVATTGHWGFNLDPAWDLEPRYDSLMRDVVHCVLGALLATELRGIVRSPSWAHFPPSLNFQLPSSNKHSPWRWLKVVGSLAIMWQIFLVYNADGGIRHFAPNNVIVTCLVGSWWMATYQMNKYDFPEVPPRRIVAWHVSGGVITTLGVALSIYPIASTIYLIMAYEGIAKLLLILLDAAVKHNVCGVQQAWALEQVAGLAQTLRAKRALEELMRAAPELAQSEEVRRLQASLRLREQNGHHSSSLVWTWRRNLKLVVTATLALLLLAAGLTQPLQYKGTTSVTGEEVYVAYGRHWCGNPKGILEGVNICSDTLANGTHVDPFAIDA